MKNKAYRINHKPGKYAYIAQVSIETTKAINKKWQNYKAITNSYQQQKFNDGYEYGIQNIDLTDDDRLNDVFFNRGYQLGIRRYKLQKEQEIKEEIETLAKQNIPIEELPDYIKNNQVNKTSYMIKKIRRK